MINQIKAGEVIERPAGLLKELLENALDANATHIKIHLENIGLDTIEVSDNGDGMSFDDLPMAFTRHATSKIRKFDDLYDLSSYGFRGEALASMASISRVICTSFQKKYNSSLIQGGKVIFHGGDMVDHHPISNGVISGTSFYIKDLFYNTPVRLKFLKSKAAERNAINRVIHSFLLIAPETRFDIKWDNQEKQSFPAVSRDDIQERDLNIFFSKRAF